MESGCAAGTRSRQVVRHIVWASGGDLGERIVKGTPKMLKRISRIYFLVIFFLLLLSYLLVSHLALLFQIFSPGFSSLLLVAYTQTIPRLLVSQTTSFRLYIYWVFVLIWVKNRLSNFLKLSVSKFECFQKRASLAVTLKQC